jgi:hypothetical protein
MSSKDPRVVRDLCFGVSFKEDGSFSINPWKLSPTDDREHLQGSCMGLRFIEWANAGKLQLEEGECSGLKIIINREDKHPKMQRKRIKVDKDLGIETESEKPREHEPAPLLPTRAPSPILAAAWKTAGAVEVHGGNVVTKALGVARDPSFYVNAWHAMVRSTHLLGRIVIYPFEKRE